jgi:peptidoglycan hydrolase-like protein with peptidoglycan-binding domain
METLAYLYAAQEYEHPEEKELNLKWANPAALTLLSIVCSTGMVSFANAAQAATTFRGDTGANVTRLQDLLRNAGYFPAATTGFFDDFTEAAVQDFQQSRGLAVDGIAGYETLEALESFVSPSKSTAPANPSDSRTTFSNNSFAPKFFSGNSLLSVRFDKFTLFGSPNNNQPAPGSVDKETLGFGDSGPRVEQLQDLLRRAGYFPGPSTGYFGAPTRQSLELFQQENGLPVDGFARQASLTALENAPAAGTN